MSKRIVQDERHRLIDDSVLKWTRVQASDNAYEEDGGRVR